MRSTFLVCAALLIAPPAFGADPIQHNLEQGLKKLSRLKYKEAIKFFEKAVKYPTATRAQRARALEGLAECYLALRRSADAESAYSRMLSENPRADLRPGVSPKLRDFFMNVKKRRFPPDMIDFRQESQSAEGGIVARMLDPWRRVARVVRVSRVGQGEWTRITIASADGSTYRIAPPVSGAEDGEWFVEAQGPDGTAVATIGTASGAFLVRGKGSARAGLDVPVSDKPQAKPGAGAVAGTVSTTESATVVKNAWTETPAATTPPSAPPAAVAVVAPAAPPAQSHTLTWVLVIAAVVVVGGLGAGGGYYLSQRPSGSAQLSLGQK